MVPQTPSLRTTDTVVSIDFLLRCGVEKSGEVDLPFFSSKEHRIFWLKSVSGGFLTLINMGLENLRPFSWKPQVLETYGNQQGPAESEQYIEIS
jgi:hypothetical protein